MIQVFKRFLLLSPVKDLSELAEKRSNTRELLLQRIDRRGTTPHLDTFESVLPADEDSPTKNSQPLHLGPVALQTIFAGFDPMADWYHFLLFLLIETPLPQDLDQ